MKYVVYCVAFLWLLHRIKNRKSIYDVVLIMALLLPDISTVEASNILMIVLLGITVFKRTNQKLCIQKDILYYVIGMMLIAVISLVSWCISGGTDAGAALRATLAVIRYPIIIFLTVVYENDFSFSSDEYIHHLYKVITVINIVEIFSCILQKLNKVWALNLFGTWYSYSDFHMAELQASSKYYRAYGTWDSPMSLGIAALLCMCLLLHEKKLRQKKLWLLNMICSFTVGVMSLTKTFFLGVIILAIISCLSYAVKNMKKKNYSVKDICGAVGIIIFALSCFVSFFAIYEWSRESWPHLHYYMGYIYEPLSAFKTRLSSTGSLADTLRVIKDNWLIGVGPVSLKGELIGDNAVILLLHNGGILACGIAVWIFGGWVAKCFLRREYNTLLILGIWMLCGMSLPVLTNYKICLLPISYYVIVSWHKREELDTCEKENIYVQTMVEDSARKECYRH